MSNSILSIRGVERRFDGTGGSTLAVQATDLEVPESDFITILGPAGCGKSTLLRIVAGLDHLTAGQVLLDGHEVHGPGADRGMVFQSCTLVPWLNVRENACPGCASAACRAAGTRKSRPTSSHEWVWAASSRTTRAGCPVACSSA